MIGPRPERCSRSCALWEEGETEPEGFPGSGSAEARRPGAPAPPPPPSPRALGTHDLRHDEQPGQGAEELAVVGEAAAAGGEVLGEGAGSGGDGMRAGALRLLHRRASAGLAPPRGPPARLGLDARPGALGTPAGGRGTRRARGGRRAGGAPRGQSRRGACRASARRPRLFGAGLSGCAGVRQEKETARGETAGRPSRAAEAGRRGGGVERGGREAGWRRTAPRRRRGRAASSPVARDGAAGRAPGRGRGRGADDPEGGAEERARGSRTPAAARPPGPAPSRGPLR